MPLLLLLACSSTRAVDTSDAVDTGDTSPPEDTAEPADTGSAEPDLDGDGYSEAAGDCDDSDSSRHPAAAYLCEPGGDQDCDGEPDPDVGPVFFTPATGGNMAMGEVLVEGATEPIEHSLDEDGTLTFCEGEWSINLITEASVTIRGPGEDLAAISGGGVGPVLSVEGEGEVVTVEGLTLREGLASTTVPLGSSYGSGDLGGGGVACAVSARVDLLDVTVEDCSAPNGGTTEEGFGGGMLITGGCTGRVFRSTFSGNGARYGGGIAVVDGDAYLEEVGLHDNTSWAQGGGLFTHGVVNAVDLEVRGNFGYFFGGGIAGAGGTLHISGCTIEDNWTDYSGGGLYLWADDASVADCSLTGNLADEDGGGIFLSDAADLERIALVENEAEEGGGVYVSFRSSSPTLYWDDLLLEGNIATTGGGLYLDTAEVRITDGTFSANIAREGGGAMLDDSTLAVSGGALTDNTVDNYGGGIYGISESTVSLSSVLVEGNSASRWGAALALGTSGWLDAAGSTFTDNQSEDYGAIYLVSSAGCEVSGSDFSGNSPADVYTDGEDYTWGKTADFRCESGDCEAL